MSTLFWNQVIFSNRFCFRFFWFLLLVSIHISDAQLEGYDPPDWQVGRIQYWSSEEPIAKLISKSEQVKSDTNKILNHIERAEDRILKNLKSQIPPGQGSELIPCNFDRKSWVDSVSSYSQGHGWENPNTDCVTEFGGTQLDPQDKNYISTSEFYDATFNRGTTVLKMLEKDASEIAFNFTNDKVDFPFNFEYSTADQRCKVHPLGAVRVGDHWYLVTSFTNDQNSIQKEDFERQFIQEAIRFDSNGKGIAAEMCLKRGSFFNETADENCTDATTGIETWKGGATASIFVGLPFEQNPAVIRALDEGDLSVQQANDATTPSSIAILFLPLALNLVPIALLAPVSTLTTLLYTLMSDVLTVFPLGIKGVELIGIGNKQVRKVFTRITSKLNNEPPETAFETAFAEVWVAECTAGSNVRVPGIIFLTLAIIFLVFGIAAEFIAKHYATKRRKLRQAILSPKQLGDSGPPSGNSQDFGVQGGHVDDLDASYDPHLLEDGKAV